MIEGKIKKSTIKRKNGFVIAKCYFPENMVVMNDKPMLDEVLKKLTTCDPHNNYVSYSIDHACFDDEDSQEMEKRARRDLKALNADKKYKARTKYPENEDVLLIDMLKDPSAAFAELSVATRLRFDLNERKEKKIST